MVFGRFTYAANGNKINEGNTEDQARGSGQDSEPD